MPASEFAKIVARGRRPRRDFMRPGGTGRRRDGADRAPGTGGSERTTVLQSRAMRRPLALAATGLTALAGAFVVDAAGGLP